MSIDTSSWESPAYFTPDSETRFRLLFENSMDGILLTSLDGRIFDANPSACAMWGRTREQVIACRRADLVDVSDPEVAHLMEERKRTGKARGEVRARHSDGRLFPIEISSAIFADTGGHEFGCVMIRDISRRKRAEAERELLIGELTGVVRKVKLLSGLLSICASCKKIHNENGQWEHLENYIRNRSAADFSHGLCPDCLERLYPDTLPR